MDNEKSVAQHIANLEYRVDLDYKELTKLKAKLAEAEKERDIAIKTKVMYLKASKELRENPYPRGLEGYTHCPHCGKGVKKNSQKIECKIEALKARAEAVGGLKHRCKILEKEIDNYDGCLKDACSKLIEAEKKIADDDWRWKEYFGAPKNLLQEQQNKIAKAIEVLKYVQNANYLLDDEVFEKAKQTTKELEE